MKSLLVLIMAATCVVGVVGCNNVTMSQDQLSTVIGAASKTLGVIAGEAVCPLVTDDNRTKILAVIDTVDGFSVVLQSVATTDTLQKAVEISLPPYLEAKIPDADLRLIVQSLIEQVATHVEVVLSNYPEYANNKSAWASIMAVSLQKAAMGMRAGLTSSLTVRAAKMSATQKE